MAEMRIERDPLGELPVPATALYGVQTERAHRNFPISGLRPLPAFVDAVIRIKKAAALTLKETGRLDAKLADAIVKAADEVLGGRHRDQFVVDVYEAGAGTSHNMNCNEVLANRANEFLGAKRGEYEPVHPNDHVNMALGYAEAAKLAKESLAKGVTVRQLIEDQDVLKGKELEDVLNYRDMTEIGVPGRKK